MNYKCPHCNEKVDMMHGRLMDPNAPKCRCCRDNLGRDDGIGLCFDCENGRSRNEYPCGFHEMHLCICKQEDFDKMKKEVSMDGKTHIVGMPMKSGAGVSLETAKGSNAMHLVTEMKRLHDEIMIIMDARIGRALTGETEDHDLDARKRKLTHELNEAYSKLLDGMKVYSMQ